MSVLKRGNSKNWYIQFQFKGKTYIRSARTTDKRLAEQMEREWKRQLHTQEFLGQKERIRITDILDQFIESKKGTPNHRNLEIHKKVLLRLFNTNRYLNEITSQDLERLKRDREQEHTSPATIKHTFGLIRGMWKYGKKMGYQISDLEYPIIKIPKHRLRYLSIDEEKRFLEELNPRRTGSGLTPFDEQFDNMKQFLIDAYDLVVILLDTGARHSEIANIEWKNINLNEKTIRLWRSKVQNESVLYMTERVYRILNRRNHSKKGVYVFMNKAGGPRGYASQSIMKAFRRAGLNDCKIHTLRHTHATRLIQNGMSVYEVKEILGHSDIKTTMRYAHLEQKDVSSRARDVINKINTQIEKPDLKVV
jgi:integrase